MTYAGAARARDPVFNEKVLAGLGKGEPGGPLPAKGRARALAELARFRRLIDAMKVADVHVVATAAARDSADGADFVREVRSLGLDCRVLGAQEEARLAGLGVVYSIPAADGIVGDLGGGSLELVEVARGRTHGGLSMPLGVLRVDPDPAGRKAAAKLVRQAVAESGLRTAGRPLYLVGGSWRALARIDMAMTDFPLPITHEYRMAPNRSAALAKVTAAADSLYLKAAPGPRHATAPVAAMVLDVLVEELQPSALIVSAAGIREGLLLSKMRASMRARDPLIEAARELASADSRFGQHGDKLDRWMAPLFADDRPGLRRLRHAACLLADVAWKANPAFRAERAIETALHGNWFGIDAPGRVLLAQALSSSFGNADLPDPRLDELCDEADLARAHQWGLAIRLGQRLSAGVGTLLDRVPLIVGDDGLGLELKRGDETLAGEMVAARLRRLADAVGMARGAR